MGEFFKTIHRFDLYGGHWVPNLLIHFAAFNIKVQLPDRDSWEFAENADPDSCVILLYNVHVGLPLVTCILKVILAQSSREYRTGRCIGNCKHQQNQV
jgi:hypothetical protein